MQIHLDVWIMTQFHILRARWLRSLALAADSEVEAVIGRFASQVGDTVILRAPEVGLVMAQARMGGSGAPFNLGEVTVTRCAVRAADGVIGQGWVQGRRPERALAIARLDAALQSEAPAEVLPVLEQLDEALAARRATIARKAAATRVEFFTLVRGED